MEISVERRIWEKIKREKQSKFVDSVDLRRKNEEIMAIDWRQNGMKYYYFKASFFK